MLTVTKFRSYLKFDIYYSPSLKSIFILSENLFFSEKSEAFAFGVFETYYSSYTTYNTVYNVLVQFELEVIVCLAGNKHVAFLWLNFLFTCSKILKQI